MENDYCIKCPNCSGLKCHFLMGHNENQIKVCANYFNECERYTNSKDNYVKCKAICTTCKGKGYLDWIESYFYYLNSKIVFDNLLEFLEDKKNLSWCVSRPRKITTKIDIKSVSKFYKDIYGK